MNLVSLPVPPGAHELPEARTMVVDAVIVAFAFSTMRRSMPAVVSWGGCWSREGCSPLEAALGPADGVPKMRVPRHHQVGQWSRECIPDRDLLLGADLLDRP